MEFKEAIDYLLDEFQLGDKIYDVRERADGLDRPDNESSWSHPDVIKFQNALDAIKEWQREHHVDAGEPIVDADPLCDRVTALEAWISRHIRNHHARLRPLEPVTPLASETQCSEIIFVEPPIRSDVQLSTLAKICQLEDGHDGDHQFSDPT